MDYNRLPVVDWNPLGRRRSDKDNLHLQEHEFHGFGDIYFHVNLLVEFRPNFLLAQGF